MITVYTASLIRTMDDQLPEATAVAVRDGVILGVGTVDSLKSWLDSDKVTIDRTHEGSVLMPGLVEPHCHPMLPSLLLQMPFIAPDDWDLPTGYFPGQITAEGYWTELGKRFAAHTGDDPFFTWGYSQWFHGPMGKAMLDEKLSSTKPVMLWERSFHQIYMNTAGLAWFGITGPSSLPDLPEVAEMSDIEDGHFWEAGLAAVMPGIQKLFLTPERMMTGLGRFGQMLRNSGVTTVCDMGMGLMLKPEQELDLQLASFSDPACGFRLLSVTQETAFAADGSTPEQAVARMDAMREKTKGGNVQVSHHFKLMADGAFYSQGFRLCSPGYIDGHQGEWIVPPPVTRQLAFAAWNAGYQLHIHVNGDEGAAFCLDLVADCFEQHPKLDHRFTMEHWGFATDEQTRRAAALGAQVSGNPFYLHVLGDKYGQAGLGQDRGAIISGYGTVLRHGMNLALHSDCPMAPIDPIQLAQAAVSRRTLDGNVVGEGEALTVEQALRAITIDAAWTLRLEETIGSIRAGKSADFTIVDRDPLVDLDGVRVLGSIYRGTPVVSPQPAASKT